MSSQRGNANRTRQQKHKNITAYKNNLHGDTPRTKTLNSLKICNVCSRCQAVLEWKIKYNKYKMLNAPSKCTMCLEKTVKHAYNILCQPCAEKSQACAKCGKKEEIVCKPDPTPAEKAQMDSQFQLELKALSERKRRTFIRYLERAEKQKEKEKEEGETGEPKEKQRNWAEEAEKRLQLLKLEVEKDNDDEDDDWDDFDDDDDDDVSDDSS